MFSIGLKGLLLSLTFFLCIFTTSSLKCYDCFWDDSPETKDERLKELSKVKDRKFPVSENYIGEKERTRAPTEEEIRRKCGVMNCQSEDSYCLKWSYISNNPKNITYTCVGNPQKRSGCFEHEIKSKDTKQYLKIQACLCDEDLCNRALSLNPMHLVTLYATLVVVLLTFYRRNYC
nr:uncharacterized protein LOC107438709 [Parasteatoda tepidariorum]